MIDFSKKYVYNEDGIRTSKTSNGVTTKFLLDGYNAIEQTDGITTLHLFYDSNGEVIGFRYNGNDYFYVKNAMSDIIAITDNNKNIVAEYRYDPWGKVLVEEDLTAIGELNPFRYRGYYYDAESGLYYLQSRYYDPVTGRFVNGDGYISTGTGVLGYNMFAYCENNPVKYKDTSGTFIGMAIGSIIGGIAGYIEAKRNNADVIKGTLIGAATGAISGLSVDAAIATGGVGGIVLAFAGGAISSALNYGLTEKANGNAVDTGEMVTEAIVGGAFNVLSFGIGDGSMKKAGGKLLKNMINNAKSTILENTTRLVRGKEVWKSNYGVVKNMAKNIMGEFMMSTTETVCSTVVLEVITYDGK